MSSKIIGFFIFLSSFMFAIQNMAQCSFEIIPILNGIPSEKDTFCYNSTIRLGIILSAECNLNEDSVRNEWVGLEEERGRFIQLDNQLESRGIRLNLRNIVSDELIASDSIFLEILPPIVPEINSSTGINACVGSEVELTVSVNTMKDRSFSYQWSATEDDSGEISVVMPSDQDSVEFFVTLTDENKCQAEDSINIALDVPTEISILGDSSYCKRDTVKLSSNDTNFVKWNWILPSGLMVDSCNLIIPNVNDSNAGKYFLTGTDFNGCTSTDSISVLLDTLDLNWDLMSQDICVDGNPISISLNTQKGFFTVDGDSSSLLIKENKFLPSIFGPGIFEIDYIASNGACRDTLNATITVNEPPQITSIAPLVFCSSDDSVNLNTIIQPAGGIFIVGEDTLSKGLFNPSEYPSLSLNLMYEYINSETQCSSKIDTTLTINSSIKVTGLDTIDICEGYPALLETIVSGGAGSYTHQWDNEVFLKNDTLVSPTLQNTLGEGQTIFRINVEDIYGCKASNPTVVNVKTQPQIKEIKVEPFCKGFPAQVKVDLIGGVDPPQFQWNYEETAEITTDSLLMTLPISESTEVQLSISYSVNGINGCEEPVDTLVVISPEPRPTPVIGKFADNTELCNFEQEIYKLSDRTAGSSIIWEPGPAEVVLDTFIDGDLFIVRWGRVEGVKPYLIVQESLANDCSGLDTLTLTSSTSNASPPADIVLSPINNVLIYNDSTACGYQWGYFNPTTSEQIELPGETAQVYVAGSNFDNNLRYWCRVRFSDCSDSACETIVSYRAKGQNDPYTAPMANEVLLFPNPNQGSFSVAGGGLFPDKDYRLEIWSSIGQLIYINQVRTIGDQIISDVELPNSTSGIYYLRLVLAGKVHISKAFVIQH